MKKQSLLFSLSVLVAMFFVEGVQAFSAGPPAAGRFEAVCVQMLPAGHGTLEQAQPGSGGFLIDTDLTLISAESGYNYTAGQTYTGTVLVKHEPAVAAEINGVDTRVRSWANILHTI